MWHNPEQWRVIVNAIIACIASLVLPVTIITMAEIVWRSGMLRTICPARSTR